MKDIDVNADDRKISSIIGIGVGISIREEKWEGNSKRDIYQRR